MTSEGANIWQFRSAAGFTAETDLIGFHVEATDGPVGRIDKLTEVVEGQYLVVDTGPWIFGRRVLLPAGTVARIEPGEQKVYVDRSKDEIKNGPELQETAAEPDAEHRDRYALYYDRFYGGPMV